MSQGQLPDERRAGQVKAVKWVPPAGVYITCRDSPPEHVDLDDLDDQELKIMTSAAVLKRGPRPLLANQCAAMFGMTSLVHAHQAGLRKASLPEK